MGLDRIMSRYNPPLDVDTEELDLEQAGWASLSPSWGLQQVVARARQTGIGLGLELGLRVPVRRSDSDSD